MPTPNEFVTSANARTSLYITRNEVIEAISSIIPALSSLSSINLFQSPNPLFSSVTINGSGQISGFVPIQTSNVIFNASTTTIGQAGNLRLTNVGNQLNRALGATDNNGTMASMRAANFYASGGSGNGFSAGWAFSSNGFVTVDGNGTPNPVLTWQYGNSNAIGLQNISTINGAPVGQGVTTYSNLTGVNINNTGVITTPSLVSLSSLNGIPLSSYTNQQLWVPYTVTVTAASNVTMVANVPQVVLTFTGLPITAAIGRFINISVPINVSPASGSVAAQTNVSMTAFIGGNVSPINTGVSAATSLSPGSGNGVRQVTLTGVVSANGPSASLQIQAVCDQNVVLTFQQGSYYTKFFFQQVV